MYKITEAEHTFLFLLAPEFQDSFRELLFLVLGAKIGTGNFRVPLTTLLILHTSDSCGMLGVVQ